MGVIPQRELRFDPGGLFVEEPRRLFASQTSIEVLGVEVGLVVAEGSVFIGRRLGMHRNVRHLGRVGQVETSALPLHMPREPPLF